MPGSSSVSPAEALATAVDGISVLGSLSPSRAADFTTCPLLYRYRTIDRLPEPLSPAAVRGSLVHKVLEQLFDLPAHDRVPERAELMLGPAWTELVADDPGLDELFDPDEDAAAFASWLEESKRALTTYFRLEDPTRLEPAEREVYVESILDSKLLVRGFIDRLDVSPTGEIRIVDYKTGRAAGEGFEMKAFFQLKIYALVWWRTHGVLPKRLQLIYLGSGHVLHYDPSEAELLATERKVNAIWDAIRRCEETGVWQPSKSKLCDWCSFQAACPEFGGAVLPLPDRVSATSSPGPLDSVQPALAVALAED